MPNFLIPTQSSLNPEQSRSSMPFSFTVPPYVFWTADTSVPSKLNQNVRVLRALCTAHYIEFVIGLQVALFRIPLRRPIGSTSPSSQRSP